MKTRLFLLEPKKGLERGNDPFWPPEEKYDGFIVRASSEDEARQVVQEYAEKDFISHYEVQGVSLRPWVDPLYTVCVEILPDGKAEVILSSYHGG
jgi:hypothetical protein